MESQQKAEEVEVVNETTSSFNRKDLVLRFLALALTLIATVLVGVDKQTANVTITLVPSLPPLSLPVTAKWTQMSAFVYFVIANAISCFYAAMSLILILATRGGRKHMSLMITILDLVVVALLFSAIGATGSVGLIGFLGNSHVQWNKVCNVFDKFCHQVVVALFMSFAGSIAYLLLIVLVALRLHKKF
ncbi:CASP-like protein 1E2 [Cynara cardunculus var. scolymus]|uniref:CASP-like protein n=1 Tax=Cynara cardunculus var. scolymus TaxID=59895 RepID=A0A103XFR0_CYNCS|nr:CASP-like protein 1E2 [Cynara cardunculus var. scolymus]KVH89851.1 Uncharacterized protein family UPF0497, trans-membrane plant [Cynara cardunculus var. scolymus]